jgi:DNA-binding response OmpR family regulator
MGADDYETKPFHNEECGRQGGDNPAPLNQQTLRPAFELPGGKSLDKSGSQEVVVRNPIYSSHDQGFAVLELLARNAPRMVRYDDIAQKVWGEDTRMCARVSNTLSIYCVIRSNRSLASGDHYEQRKLGYRLQRKSRSNNRLFFIILFYPGCCLT